MTRAAGIAGDFLHVGLCCVSIVTAILVTSACSPVSDGTAAEVLIADRSPRPLQPAFWLGGEPEEPTGLLVPQAIVATADEIVVLDSGRQELVYFDHEGEYKGSAGRSGPGPGEFEFSSQPGTRGGRLAATDEGLFVVDHDARRIHVWSHDREFVRVLQSPTWIGDLVATDTHLVIGSTTEQAAPGISWLNLGGDVEARVAVPMYMGGGERARTLSASTIAPAGSGTVLQAFRHWPALRRLSQQGVSREVWIEHQWSEDASVAESLNRPRSLLEERQPQRLDPEVSTIVALDVEFVPVLEGWVVLYNTHYAQVFSSTLEPLDAFRLEPVTTPGRRGIDHWDLTVTPDGRLLCGAGKESACCYGPMSWGDEG